MASAVGNTALSFDKRKQKPDMMQIVRGNYLPIASTYSKGLKDLVDMTLRVDPKRRPTVNEVLKMPVLQERIAKFLSATVRSVLQHTSIACITDILMCC